MNTLLTALGDPTIRSWYLAFCVALMALPMVGLAWWYHAAIRKTEGVEAAAMARDIASGKYGKAGTIQNRVYWMAGLWVLANFVVLSLLLWADEVNRYGKPPLYEGKNQYQDKGRAPTPGPARHGDTK